jgi:lipid II:glycine glycyltransferase (peptidoglycan interpeptide bridge formation enzyme)
MHRRNARTAQKRGVHIEIGKSTDHLKAFYQLHMDTRHRQGVPVQPWCFFDLLGKILLEDDLGFILVAYQREKPIAGMVLLKWGQTLTYKYGASCSENLDLRPNDLIFWTAIQWGCEHGYKVFDFGRTDVENEGLRTFKSRWGAKEIPLFYSVFSKKTQQQPHDRMMSLMNIMIRNSPAWVCRSAGELLYRHFG